MSLSSLKGSAAPPAAGSSSSCSMEELEHAFASLSLRDGPIQKTHDDLIDKVGVLFDFCRRNQVPLPFEKLVRWHRLLQKQTISYFGEDRKRKNDFLFSQKRKIFEIVLDFDDLSIIQYYTHKGAEDLSGDDLRELEFSLFQVQEEYKNVSYIVQHRAAHRLHQIVLEKIKLLTKTDKDLEEYFLDWEMIAPTSPQAIILADKFQVELERYRRALRESAVLQEAIANFADLDEESVRVMYICALERLSWYTGHLEMNSWVDLSKVEKKIGATSCARQLLSELQSQHKQGVERFSSKAVFRADVLDGFTRLAKLSSEYFSQKKIILSYERALEIFEKASAKIPFFARKQQLIPSEKLDFHFPFQCAEMFDAALPLDIESIKKLFLGEERGIFEMLQKVTSLNLHDINEIFQRRVFVLEREKPASSSKESVDLQDFLPKSCLVEKEAGVSKKKQHKARKAVRHSVAVSEGGRSAEKKAASALTKILPAASQESPDIAPPAAIASQTGKAIEIRKDLQDIGGTSSSPSKIVAVALQKSPQQASSSSEASRTIKAMEIRKDLRVISGSEWQLRNLLQIESCMLHAHVRKSFCQKETLSEELQPIKGDLFRHTYPTIIARLVQKIGRKLQVYSDHRKQFEDSFTCVGSISRGQKEFLLGIFTEGFFSQDNCDGKKGMLYHHCFKPFSQQDITSYIFKRAVATDAPVQMDESEVLEPMKESAGRFTLRSFRYRMELYDEKEEVTYTLAAEGPIVL